MESLLIFGLKSQRDPEKTDNWLIFLELASFCPREVIFLLLSEMKQYHQSCVESIITLSAFPPWLELSHRCGEAALISPSPAASHSCRVTLSPPGDSSWTITVAEIPGRCLNNPLIEQLFSNKRSPQARRLARKSIKIPITSQALGGYLVSGCQTSRRRSDFGSASFLQSSRQMRLAGFI